MVGIPEDILIRLGPLVMVNKTLSRFVGDAVKVGGNVSGLSIWGAGNGGNDVSVSLISVVNR